MQTAPMGNSESKMRFAKMKNLLMVPSWFAIPGSPSAGTFFTEQARLLSQDFNVRLLANWRHPVSYHTYMWHKIIGREMPLLKYDNGSIWTALVQYECSQNPPLKRKFEEHLFGQIKGYFNAILQFKNEGFYPDVILAQSTYMGGLIARAISKEFGIPYLIIEHMQPFDYDLPDQLKWDMRFRDALKNAKSVLAVSSFIRNNLLYNRGECNPEVIGNYVDDRLFMIPAKANNPFKDGFNLLTVAYFPGVHKDIPNLLSALKILLTVTARNMNINLTIVGGGEPCGGFNGENMIDAMVRQADLDNFVRIIPSATRTEMSNLMQKCDIYVLPSIWESFGISPCEAMLCGKPVVVTDCGGTREFFDIRMGCMVRTHDASALANGIKEVINHYQSYSPDLIRSLIVARFGEKVFYQQLKRRIDDVLA